MVGPLRLVAAVVASKAGEGPSCSIVQSDHEGKGWVTCPQASRKSAHVVADVWLTCQQVEHKSALVVADVWGADFDCGG